MRQKVDQLWSGDWMQYIWETLGEYGYIHSLDYGDGFLCVYFKSHHI
jgi:hypothetical protein